MSAVLLSAGSALVAVLALILERLAGYPDRLHAAIRHPVVWMGWLVDRLERTLNPADGSAGIRRRGGAAALGALLAATLIVTLPITLFLRMLPGGLVIEALLASTLLSQKSLRQHVAAVADGLDTGIDDARVAVSHIVGRDPQQLDASDISRAAIESLAENASDGVTAPLFWLVIAGLPGIALYKAINTADSMIGHRSPRYADFGWASARLDDAVNLPASRLTGLVFALAAGLGDRAGGRAAWRAMRRDAGRHQSPNAGWPEAAMAGAVGIRLGGPRSYGGAVTELAWMGEGRTALTAADIRAALTIYGRALNLLLAAALVWFALLWTVS